jgi:hypothetical protein
MPAHMSATGPTDMPIYGLSTAHAGGITAMSSAKVMISFFVIVLLSMNIPQQLLFDNI